MFLSRRRFVQTAVGALGSAPLLYPLKVMTQGVVESAPGMPPPQFIDTNGIRMAVYEQGEGFPVVFAHGFPELAYSWRHQLPAFASSGFRAIAPDMRGYGLTDRPGPVQAYTVRELCKDLVGLLDALSLDRAVFCGHDWGGMPAWTMPRLYPDRVAGVIGVNTPAFGAAAGVSAVSTEEPLIVRTERYYTNTFQPPGQAEAILEKDVRRSLEVFFCRGWYWDVQNIRRFPRDSAERTMDLLRMIEEGRFLGQRFMTEDEITYYTKTFEVTGFTGGLNYYRASAQDGFSNAVDDIRVPCLYVGAENDTILRPSSADQMPAFIPDLERHVVGDCGHWTQQEKPAEFNRVARDWLNRKFVV